MAKKNGDICKERLTQAILDLYPGNAFIQDKNIYINFIEGGEKIQLKIAMTQPKSIIEASGMATIIEDTGNWDWNESTNKTVPTSVSAEITQEEQDNLRTLLEKLNL